MNAFEMMKLTGFNGAPGVRICTVSGAGDSSINGDYYAYNVNDAVAKHETNDRYILFIPNEHNGNTDAYVIYASSTHGYSQNNLCSWLASSGFNPNSEDIYYVATLPKPTIHA
jgi:hypothetical protein